VVRSREIGNERDGARGDRGKLEVGIRKPKNGNARRRRNRTLLEPEENRPQPEESEGSGRVCPRRNVVRVRRKEGQSPHPGAEDALPCPVCQQVDCLLAFFSMKGEKR